MTTHANQLVECAIVTSYSKLTCFLLEILYKFFILKDHLGVELCNEIDADCN